MSAGSNGHITEGSLDDSYDLPTRVLDGATELVTNPGSAPLAAATLVEADHFEVTGATVGEDDSTDVLRLQWTPDRHVVLHRHWAPFAGPRRPGRPPCSGSPRPSRASRGTPRRCGWVEPVKGGGTVWIRLARPEDAEAVEAMHGRCSEKSRYQRYFSPVNEWRDVNLRRITGGHRGATLVVMSEEGAIVGLGNVFPDSPGDGRAAEVAMIVEDAYQGRGVGTRLLRHMLEFAERLGFAEITATVLAENTGMLRVLEAPGLSWTKELEQGVLTMRAPLPVPEAGTLTTGPAAGDSG